VNATGGTENGTGTEPTETVEIGGTDEWVRKLPVVTKKFADASKCIHLSSYFLFFSYIFGVPR
jgi:hypothetical protein